MNISGRIRVQVLAFNAMKRRDYHYYSGSWPILITQDLRKANIQDFHNPSSR